MQFGWRVGGRGGFEQPFQDSNKKPCTGCRQRSQQSSTRIPKSPWRSWKDFPFPRSQPQFMLPSVTSLNLATLNSNRWDPPSWACSTSLRVLAASTCQLKGCVVTRGTDTRNSFDILPNRTSAPAQTSLASDFLPQLRTRKKAHPSVLRSHAMQAPKISNDHLRVRGSGSIS